MPIDYIKDLSNKHNITVDKLETHWNNAKETIGVKYSDDEKAKYGAIVKVFKNMINKEFDLHESEILTVEDGIFVARKVLNETKTISITKYLDIYKGTINSKSEIDFLHTINFANLKKGDIIYDKNGKAKYMFIGKNGTTISIKSMK